VLAGAAVVAAGPALSPYPSVGFASRPAIGSGWFPIISQFARILNNRC
jgi:hypothetical protein